MDGLLEGFEKSLREARDVESLGSIKSQYSGQGSRLAALFKELASAPGIDKKTRGAELIKIREYINGAIEAKKQIFIEEQVLRDLQNESLDMTLPARPRDVGLIHPCNFVLNEVVNIFSDMGFACIEGPEIEDDFHNFAALNTPPNHPARQMQDTFYIEESFGGRNILRTHTSNAQIYTMLNSKPPICMISPGRVFRRDFDATHTPMFHQIEGLCVREDTSVADLMGCIREFVTRFFVESKIDFRFRPSYFPFTKPSLELDIRVAGGEWLEILGCGMVHPNVFKNVNVDPVQYTGFAFGIGIERLAMLKYGISDIRELFDVNSRWLRSVGFSPIEYMAR